jgi:sulfate adenylyltransferase large subunit
MNVHSRPGELTPGEHHLGHAQSLLRFVACGSVDHGKSTLLGRLLYESKQLFTDQLETLAADSRKYGTQGEELDYSLLLDGLAAEREQNITIDVAYRFFSTPRRKFIVIDTPGHEQYSANMATGASVADLALVLVSANEGLTRQTRRHIAIVGMLGITDVVLVVNKMDRADWRQDTFRELEAEFRDIAADSGIGNVVAIPVAAKSGDNIASRSSHMPWYRGTTLLDYLEHVEPARADARGPLRMPIQLVNRPDARFRGYSGLITSGTVEVGMPAKIFPSGAGSRIARIVTYDGDLVRAEAGQSVTLTLADQIDASRGDIIADAEHPPTVTQRIGARVFWMGERPLQPGRKYLAKLATRTVSATAGADLTVIDLDQRRTVGAKEIAPNAIGTCTLEFDRPVAVDRYSECKDTGSFILIDPENFDTVGMGCVERVDAQAPRRRRSLRETSKSAKPPAKGMARWTESHARSLAKAVSWRMTGSLDTFIVAFVITRTLKIAASVALTEVVTKILIYYFHERAWALVPWGKHGAAKKAQPATVATDA